MPIHHDNYHTFDAHHDLIKAYDQASELRRGMKVVTTDLAPPGQGIILEVTCPVCPVFPILDDFIFLCFFL